MRGHQLLGVVSLVLVATAGVLAAADQRAPGGTNPLMIPAAAFAADGDDPANIINYGDWVEAITGTQHVRAAVHLPNSARITYVQAVVRDTDSSHNINIYLKRNKFGVMDDEYVATMESPGTIPPNGGGLVFPGVSLMNHRVDAANYAYWLEVILRAPEEPGAVLELYGVRIGFEVGDVIFADTFESEDTVMWSAASGAAKAYSAWAPPETSAWDPRPPLNPLPEGRPAWMHVDDPAAEAALDAAFAKRDGYGSPVVIPGPSFKAVGYLDHDNYYIGTLWGAITCRPDEPDGAILQAPVHLPEGAEIGWYMAFFVDTRPDALVSGNIRFWLSRVSTWDRSTQNLVYATSSGTTAGIRSLSINAGDMNPADPVWDTSHWFYWVTTDVGPYDASDDYWHKMYAVVILYTMP